MIKQIIDQALAIQIPQVAQGQNIQGAQEENGFDSMVRQKCQEKDAQKPAEKEPAGKQESVKEKQQPKEGEEQSQDLQAMAAAMLLQRPEIVDTEAAATPQVEEAVPVIVQETAVETPVVQEAVAEAQPQQVQVQTAQPQQTEVQMEQAVETPEEAPVQQVLPEDAQPQDQMTDTTEQPKTQEAPEVKVSVTPEKAEETEEPEEVPAETPVFSEVETVPVKVAAPEEKPVELEAPDGTEQLAQRLTTAEQADLSHVEVTLTPENLGKITVEFTRADNGALSVVISATTPKAAAVLEQHTSSLQNLLAGSTQNEVRVEVRETGEAPQQFLNPEGQNQQGRQEQQNQQHRQEREDHKAAQDFVQQLRLGLVGLDSSET